jgi:hypothetical protein
MPAISASTFSVAANGNLRQSAAFVPGTSVRHSTLELHAFLQDLADNPTTVGDDLVSILGSNPSELAGKRNVNRPAALTLLPTLNIDDATSQWFQFGSLEQNAGADLYTGLKVIGSLVASSPIYILQNNAKLTKYWADADVNTSFQILVKAKSANVLIDSGNITVYSRKYGQSYSHFDAALAAGGEQAAALATSLDGNINVAVMTPAIAASYFSTAIGGTAAPGTQRITLAYANTTQDLGGGQGALLHRGTITLNGTISLAQAYQALMWATSESSPITFNAIPGFRYRMLPGQTYPENIAAPFGAFAGGRWFVARGWWLTGVQIADSRNYQLLSDNGTVQTPPTSVAVQIGGVSVGDYVLVARDNGGGGILTSEYTVSAAAAATTVTVPSLKADTPATGVIRIAGDRYTYTSWSGTTVSGLSPAIRAGGYTGAAAFIPLIDTVAAATPINSSVFQFTTPFTCRFRVRNGTGGSAIVPFESTLSVTETGGSGTAVRNADE